MQCISDSVLMNITPGPTVQISPAIAQDVIALQAAELVRLRAELGNEHSKSQPEFPWRELRAVVSVDQFNELRRDLLDAVFTSKETNDLRAELIALSDRLRAMQGLLEDLCSHAKRASADVSATQPEDGSPTMSAQTDHHTLKIDDLQNQLTAAREELSDVRSMNISLEDQRLKNEARVSDLVKQLFAAHVESHDLQDLLKGAQDAYALSQTTASGMDAEMALLREENRQLTQQVESLAVEANKKQIHLEELNELFAATIAQHEEEVASLCMAVEVVKDANPRPGLLGTVRNKVAQVYKGVGGYLPQQHAADQPELIDGVEPSRTTVIVEEPLSDTNVELSASTLKARDKSRAVEDAAESGDSGSSTTGSVVSLYDVESDFDHRPLDELVNATGEQVARRDVGTPRSAEHAQASMASGSGSHIVTDTALAVGPSQAKPSTKIEDVLTPLPMRVITQAALDHLQRSCGSRQILYVTASDFVCRDSVEHAYFVKRSTAFANGVWAPCKHATFRKRMAKGPADLLTQISGFLYYLGTYTIVDDPEPLTREDFQELPELTRRCIATTTAQKERVMEILSQYDDGTLVALRYPACRVGFDDHLDDELRAGVDKS